MRSPDLKPRVLLDRLPDVITMYFEQNRKRGDWDRYADFKENSFISEPYHGEVHSSAWDQRQRVDFDTRSLQERPSHRRPFRYGRPYHGYKNYHDFNTYEYNNESTFHGKDYSSQYYNSFPGRYVYHSRAFRGRGYMEGQFDKFNSQSRHIDSLSSRNAQKHKVTPQKTSKSSSNLVNCTSTVSSIDNHPQRNMSSRTITISCNEESSPSSRIAQKHVVTPQKTITSPKVNSPNSVSSIDDHMQSSSPNPTNKESSPPKIGDSSPEYVEIDNAFSDDETSEVPTAPQNHAKTDCETETRLELWLSESENELDISNTEEDLLNSNVVCVEQEPSSVWLSDLEDKPDTSSDTDDLQNSDVNFLVSGTVGTETSHNSEVSESSQQSLVPYQSVPSLTTENTVGNTSVLYFNTGTFGVKHSAQVFTQPKPLYLNFSLPCSEIPKIFLNMPDHLVQKLVLLPSMFQPHLDRIFLMRKVLSIYLNGPELNNTLGESVYASVCKNSFNSLLPIGFKSSLAETSTPDNVKDRTSSDCTVSEILEAGDSISENILENFQLRTGLNNSSSDSFTTKNSTCESLQKNSSLDISVILNIVHDKRNKEMIESLQNILKQNPIRTHMQLLKTAENKWVTTAETNSCDVVGSILKDMTSRKQYDITEASSIPKVQTVMQEPDNIKVAKSLMLKKGYREEVVTFNDPVDTTMHIPKQSWKLHKITEDSDPRKRRHSGLQFVEQNHLYVDQESRTHESDTRITKNLSITQSAEQESRLPEVPLPKTGHVLDPRKKNIFAKVFNKNRRKSEDKLVGNKSRRLSNHDNDCDSMRRQALKKNIDLSPEPIRPKYLGNQIEKRPTNFSYPLPSRIGGSNRNPYDRSSSAAPVRSTSSSVRTASEKVDSSICSGTKFISKSNAISNKRPESVPRLDLSDAEHIGQSFVPASDMHSKDNTQHILKRRHCVKVKSNTFNFSTTVKSIESSRSVQSAKSNRKLTLSNPNNLVASQSKNLEDEPVKKNAKLVKKSGMKRKNEKLLDVRQTTKLGICSDSENQENCKIKKSKPKKSYPLVLCPLVFYSGDLKSNACLKFLVTKSNGLPCLEIKSVEEDDNDCSIPFPELSIEKRVQPLILSKCKGEYAFVVKPGPNSSKESSDFIEASSSRCFQDKSNVCDTKQSLCVVQNVDSELKKSSSKIISDSHNNGRSAAETDKTTSSQCIAPVCSLSLTDANDHHSIVASTNNAGKTSSPCFATASSVTLTNANAHLNLIMSKCTEIVSPQCSPPVSSMPLIDTHCCLNEIASSNSTVSRSESSFDNPASNSISLTTSSPRDMPVIVSNKIETVLPSNQILSLSDGTVNNNAIGIETSVVVSHTNCRDILPNVQPAGEVVGELSSPEPPSPMQQSQFNWLDSLHPADSVDNTLIENSSENEGLPIITSVVSLPEHLEAIGVNVSEGGPCTMNVLAQELINNDLKYTISVLEKSPAEEILNNEEIKDCIRTSYQICQRFCLEDSPNRYTTCNYNRLCYAQIILKAVSRLFKKGNVPIQNVDSIVANIEKNLNYFRFLENRNVLSGLSGPSLENSHLQNRLAETMPQQNDTLPSQREAQATISMHNVKESGISSHSSNAALSEQTQRNGTITRNSVSTVDKLANSTWNDTIIKLPQAGCVSRNYQQGPSLLEATRAVYTPGRFLSESSNVYQSQPTANTQVPPATEKLRDCSDIFEETDHGKLRTLLSTNSAPETAVQHDHNPRRMLSGAIETQAPLVQLQQVPYQAEQLPSVMQNQTQCLQSFQHKENMLVEQRKPDRSVQFSSSDTSHIYPKREMNESSYRPQCQYAEQPSQQAVQVHNANNRMDFMEAQNLLICPPAETRSPLMQIIPATVNSHPSVQTFGSTGNSHPSPSVQTFASTGNSRPSPSVQTFASTGNSRPSPSVQTFASSGNSRPSPSVQTFASSGNSRPSPSVQTFASSGNSRPSPSVPTFASAGNSRPSLSVQTFASAGSNHPSPLVQTFASPGINPPSLSMQTFASAGSNRSSPLMQTFASTGNSCPSPSVQKFASTGNGHPSLSTQTFASTGNSHPSVQIQFSTENTSLSHLKQRCVSTINTVPSPTHTSTTPAFPTAAQIISQTKGLLSTAEKTFSPNGQVHFQAIRITQSTEESKVKSVNLPVEQVQLPVGQVLTGAQNSVPSTSVTHTQPRPARMKQTNTFKMHSQTELVSCHSAQFRNSPQENMNAASIPPINAADIPPMIPRASVLAPPTELARNSATSATYVQPEQPPLRMSTVLTMSSTLPQQVTSQQTSTSCASSQQQSTLQQTSTTLASPLLQSTLQQTSTTLSSSQRQSTQQQVISALPSSSPQQITSALSSSQHQKLATQVTPSAIAQPSHPEQLALRVTPSVFSPLNHLQKLAAQVNRTVCASSFQHPQSASQAATTLVSSTSPPQQIAPFPNATQPVTQHRIPSVVNQMPRMMFRPPNNPTTETIYNQADKGKQLDAAFERSMVPSQSEQQTFRPPLQAGNQYSGQNIRPVSQNTIGYFPRTLSQNSPHIRLGYSASNSQPNNFNPLVPPPTHLRQNSGQVSGYYPHQVRNFPNQSTFPAQNASTSHPHQSYGTPSMYNSHQNSIQASSLRSQQSPALNRSAACTQSTSTYGPQRAWSQPWPQFSQPPPHIGGSNIGYSQDMYRQTSTPPPIWHTPQTATTIEDGNPQHMVPPTSK